MAGIKGADVWDLGRSGVTRVGAGVGSIPPDVVRRLISINSGQKHLVECWHTINASQGLVNLHYAAYLPSSQGKKSKQILERKNAKKDTIPEAQLMSVHFLSPTVIPPPPPSLNSLVKGRYLMSTACCLQLFIQ